MRKGRLGRLARLGGMAAGLAGDAAGAAARLTTARTEEAAASFHRHAARRMLRVFGEMKGLPLKAGQMLSYIDEVIPVEYRFIYNEVLGNLQLHTRTMELEDIEEVFCAEFDGKRPAEVFAHFDPEPIAAASIGQVYHAVTHEGAEVAVKVQYPGVLEAIESDLENVDTLVSAMSAVMPKTDMHHFVQDIVAKIQEECDYTMEADYQRAFVLAWAGDDKVVIPTVVDQYCTHRVLVQQFLHGQEWAEMQRVARPDQKMLYGREIFRFVFQSLFCHGMFNGDPHPGNYLFYPDGRVAFIDYGCVQRYPPEQRSLFQELRQAVLADLRGEPFQDLLRRVFGLPDDMDAEMQTVIEDYMHLTFEPFTRPQPYRFTREYTQQLLEKVMDAKMLMTRKLLSGKAGQIFETQHQGVAFLGRINFGLGAILVALETQADFRAMLAAMDG